MWDAIDAGSWLRAAMVLAGVFLFSITMVSLAKRQMTDSFVLAWVLVSVIFVLGGIFLHPTELDHYISETGFFLVGAAVFCVVFGAYFISVRISELIRRNLELTMQVTLLKQEITALEARNPEGDVLLNEEGIDRYQYVGTRRG